MLLSNENYRSSKTNSRTTIRKCYNPSQFNFSAVVFVKNRREEKVLVVLNQVLPKNIHLQQFLESGY